jgi:hypothetical protein
MKELFYPLTTIIAAIVVVIPILVECKVRIERGIINTQILLDTQKHAGIL